MLIKVYGELIVVDYIYNIGKIYSNKFYDDEDDDGEYKSSFQINFLNQKSIEFYTYTKRYEPTGLEDKIVDEICLENNLEKNDYQGEAWIKLFRSKKFNLKYNKYHKNVLLPMCIDELKNVQNFITIAIQKFQDNNISKIETLDYPKYTNFKY